MRTVVGTRCWPLLLCNFFIPLLHGAEPPAAEGTTATLPSDARHELWIPRGYAPRENQVDLLVHFHGAAPLVRHAAADARRQWIVATVEYRGFSSVYRKPFAEDRDRFGQLLEEAMEAARDAGAIPATARIGRLAVSSFSAGFGAVREILKTPKYFDQIDGIVLVDSLYAGYVGDGTDTVEEGNVHPGLMKDFVRFAEGSAAGEKSMIVTHTEVPTEGYANTRETADYLLQQLGLSARRVDRALPPPNSAGTETRRLQLSREAERQGFKLYGTAGNDAAEHVSHLRHLAIWLDKL